MLFEDEESMEYDNLDHSSVCIAVPLKACISLKDLWVPSHLLSNGNKTIDSSKHRSSVFHTLEKRNFESLSVYSEEESLDDREVHRIKEATTCQKHVSSILEEQSSPNQLLSDETAKLISLSETELDNDKQIKNFFAANSKKLMYESFSECLNYLVTESPEKQTSDNQEYKIEQFVNLLDIINSGESSSDESFENSLNVAASGFPHVETVNNEQPLCNDKPKCPKNTDIPIVSETHESVLDDDKQCVDKICVVNSEEPLNDCQHAAVEELPGDKMEFVSSKASVEDSMCKVLEELPRNEIDFVNSEESPRDDCQHTAVEELHRDEIDFVVSEESPEDCQYTAVKELPIAYKRPPLEEEKISKRQRQQKKKNKYASNRNVQLADFLQKVNTDGCEIPQRDEFYESLVKRGLCPPPDIDVCNDKKEDNCSSFQSAGIEYFGAKRRKEESLTLSMESFPCTFFQPSVVECNEEKITESQSLQSDSPVQDPVDEKPATTLVLDNIFSNITKENIEGVMSGFGVLKEVSVEPHGKILKVYVKLILENDDVDWIIECLNDYELFGAEGGKVKCYKP